MFSTERYCSDRVCQDRYPEECHMRHKRALGRLHRAENGDIQLAWTNWKFLQAVATCHSYSIGRALTLAMKGYHFKVMNGLGWLDRGRVGSTK
jgi:hypothetical protein